MDEYRAKCGARATSGMWLDSTVRIVAESADEAWEKLSKLNRGMRVTYPPIKTGRTARIKVSQPCTH
jgi:hypothetical protein